MPNPLPWLVRAARRQPAQAALAFVVWEVVTVFSARDVGVVGV